MQHRQNTVLDVPIGQFHGRKQPVDLLKVPGIAVIEVKPQLNDAAHAFMHCFFPLSLFFGCFDFCCRLIVQSLEYA